MRFHDVTPKVADLSYINSETFASPASPACFLPGERGCGSGKMRHGIGSIVTWALTLEGYDDGEVVLQVSVGNSWSIINIAKM